VRILFSHDKVLILEPIDQSNHLALVDGKMRSKVSLRFRPFGADDIENEKPTPREPCAFEARHEFLRNRIREIDQAQRWTRVESRTCHGTSWSMRSLSHPRLFFDSLRVRSRRART
jgi:hypothetical protein